MTSTPPSPAPIVPPSPESSAVVPPEAVPQPAMVAGPRWSVLAFVALALAVLLTLSLLILKLIGASLALSEDDQTPLATALGILLLLGIVPDAIAIVLGHVALARTKGGIRRGGAVAGAALGLAYFHVLLWAGRLIAATIVAGVGGDPSQFVPDIFWWA